jgi:UDPglucose 6-dehydrogenase
MRESPALDIVPALMKAGITVRAYDPEGMAEAAKMIDGLETCESVEAAMTDADALVIITEWNEFRALDPVVIKERLRQPVVVDLRNIFSPADMASAGIRYFSIGRPEAT